jgi:thymidylate kinase
VRVAAIARLHRDLEGELPVPDLALVLDADPLLLARRERPGAMDAFDADLDFQVRVRDAYTALAAAERHTRLVDATGEPDAVTARLVAALEAAGVIPTR